MIILEEPYVSEMLIRYLEESNTPVLENNFAKRLSSNKINLKSEFDFIGGYCQSKKIYTVSEHALEWINLALNDYELNEQIALLKNKAAFRSACQHLYQDFFFEELSYTELFTFDISELQLPLVLKPSVGFLSVSVYTILCKEDWDKALIEILKNIEEQTEMFPDTVFRSDTFILESYIKGREFAVDLYFCDKEPVIINIFEHLFSSVKDVSDRLYITSKEIFDNYLTLFTEYINHLNTVLDLDNIPVHIELRVDESNNILPIEINPLRFAGMCLNEIHFYIAEKHPLQYYFSHTKPNYKTMWEGKENEFFCFSILEKNEHSEDSSSNIASLMRNYSNILELRMIEHPKLDIQAFVFSKTSNKKEFSDILELRIR